MARYDELEHDGDELFSVQSREQEPIVKAKIEKKVQVLKEKTLEEQQIKWLSVDNPYIWTGDFDSDD